MISPSGWNFFNNYIIGSGKVLNISLLGKIIYFKLTGKQQQQNKGDVVNRQHMSNFLLQSHWQK